jgi:hypothetical protein
MASPRTRSKSFGVAANTSHIRTKMTRFGSALPWHNSHSGARSIRPAGRLRHMRAQALALCLVSVRQRPASEHFVRHRSILSRKVIFLFNKNETFITDEKGSQTIADAPGLRDRDFLKKAIAQSRDRMP